jgi:hypothetical protein
VKSATDTTSLPGAPDDEWVVIEFDTVFENKRATVETVTPIPKQTRRGHRVSSAKGASLVRAA